MELELLLHTLLLILRLKGYLSSLVHLLEF